eukprot:6251194-Prymnesium_polylepis.1
MERARKRRRDRTQPDAGTQDADSPFGIVWYPSPALAKCMRTHQHHAPEPRYSSVREAADVGRLLRMGNPIPDGPTPYGICGHSAMI